MKKTLLIIVILAYGPLCVFGQNYMDISNAIHSTIAKDGKDPWAINRNALKLLEHVPINSTDDTIYAIECYSEIGGFFIAMYWSRSFLYSVDGILDDTMKVYKKPIWYNWLISMVELWDTNTILNLQTINLEEDINYCISRTIVNLENTRTEYIFTDYLYYPDESRLERAEHWNLWQNRDDYIAVFIVEPDPADVH